MAVYFLKTDFLKNICDLSIHFVGNTANFKDRI